MFDDIPGHEPGYRVLVNFFGGKRKNMTLGFPTELSKIELSEAYYAAQLKDLTPIPYETVEDGPVTENVFEGDDVDLGKFPAPFWHPEDGGHYIGTGSYDVTVDPDTGWMNLGTYRVMVQDEKTVGYYISPGKHGRVHRDKYLARGEPIAERDHGRRRPDDVSHRLHRDAARTLRIRHRRRHAGRAAQGDPGPPYRHPVPGRRGDRARRLRRSRGAPPPRGRSANGPAITAPTCARSR